MKSDPFPFSDTNVYYNIYHFHTDANYWPEAQIFQPSRFITLDQGQVKMAKKEHFIPFGFGKRVCMGKSLAKAELWLFATAILQKFTIKLPSEHPVPNPKDDIAGLTRSPRPFYIQLALRHVSREVEE